MSGEDVEEWLSSRPLPSICVINAVIIVSNLPNTINVVIVIMTMIMILVMIVISIMIITSVSRMALWSVCAFLRTLSIYAH